MSTVWRLATATALMVMGFSITAPVLAVQLQQAGHGTALVGAFAMIPFAVIFVLMPFMPRVLARHGLVRAYHAGCVLELAGALGFALGDGLLVWSLASAIGSIGSAALWNATEALLAQEAPPERRGHVMGLYQTGLGATLALGPFAPALLGWTARPLLWLGAALILGCALVAWQVPHAPASRREAAESEPAGIWQALRTLPAMACLAFAGGVFEAGLGSVTSAHAAALGLSLSGAASVAGAIGTGSFLCQYPAGAAADRFSPRAVFGTAGLLLLGASGLFALVPWAPWLLWASGSVWGGVGGALYTLCMVRVAHAYGGRSAAGGTSAMITCYTAGGAIGPLLSGAALQWAGAGGLAALLGLLSAGALAAASRLPAQHATQGLPAPEGG